MKSNVNGNEKWWYKSFISSDYGDSKLSKNMELNHDMTIAHKSPDELTKTLRTLGGSH